MVEEGGQGEGWLKAVSEGNSLRDKRRGLLVEVSEGNSWSRRSPFSCGQLRLRHDEQYERNTYGGDLKIRISHMRPTIHLSSPGMGRTLSVRSPSAHGWRLVYLRRRPGFTKDPREEGDGWLRYLRRGTGS